MGFDSGVYMMSLRDKPVAADLVMTGPLIKGACWRQTSLGHAQGETELKAIFDNAIRSAAEIARPPAFGEMEQT